MGGRHLDVRRRRGERFCYQLFMIGDRYQIAVLTPLAFVA